MMEVRFQSRRDGGSDFQITAKRRRRVCANGEIREVRFHSGRQAMEHVRFQQMRDKVRFQ